MLFLTLSRKLLIQYCRRVFPYQCLKSIHRVTNFCQCCASITLSCTHCIHHDMHPCVATFCTLKLLSTVRCPSYHQQFPQLNHVIPQVFSELFNTAPWFHIYMFHVWHVWARVVVCLHTLFYFLSNIPMTARHQACCLV